MFRLSVLACLFLSSCAAVAPSPCQRQCNAIYDTCMDVGGAVDNPQAMRNVEYQCGVAARACERTCGE
jgi:hypothetical protein